MTNSQCEVRRHEFFGEPTIWCKCGSRTGRRGARINQRWRDLGRYCCSTAPCHRRNNTIICKNGIVKNVTDHCGDELSTKNCPTSNSVSSSALSVNQDQFQCYETRDKLFDFSKVHLTNNQIIPDQDFAFTFCGVHGGSICDMTLSTGKTAFQQCYSKAAHKSPR